MKKLILSLSLWLSFLTASAQIPVTDGANLSQSFLNFGQHLVTAGNTLDAALESKRIYEQAKEYYNTLRSVNNLIRGGRKITECARISTRIIQDYNQTIITVCSESYFSPKQIDVYNRQQSNIMKGVANVIGDMTNVITVTGLSMTDKERMDAIDTYYSRIVALQNKSRGINLQMRGEIHALKERRVIRRIERELLR